MKKCIENEKGITLIALIITVIVLVLLAAVSISAAYQSGIIKYAVNGTTEYYEQGHRENVIINGTESFLSSKVTEIESTIKEIEQKGQE